MAANVQISLGTNIVHWFWGKKVNASKLVGGGEDWEEYGIGCDGEE